MSPTRKDSPILKIVDLAVSYDQAPVVQGIGLEVWPQQIVALVGPNGAGKTSVMKAVGGLLKAASGSVIFEGRPIQDLEVWERVRDGIVYVPEGMSVFPEMSVLENLEIGAYLNRKAISRRIELVFGLFPELSDKRAVRAQQLSGGEQRMVTLGRGLMSGAKLLLLDDPFLGLSPKIIRRFCETFNSLRSSGMTLLIAGQHVRRILHVADLAFLIEDGAVTLSGSGHQLLHDDHLREILFGLERRPEP